ncbi:protein-disulfide reductase DsbD [Marinobacter oulmenensis]|uniref:Thiol:disulfide interchange protein DsbD n=1 Tax=Marinobacter oulmenensis TaxID=643747 RepID=A0A840UBC2_9GAMM|nr:protein-disulfide reductase DsbD [Marinobacter oulmenensis]MBB5322429.1 thiol:disulfide interchange protein DsbD [Marinobacter oulmenensis]
MTVFSAFRSLLRAGACALGPVLFSLALLLVPGQGHALGDGGTTLLGSGGQGDFLPVDEALPFNYTTDDGAVRLSWQITPGHYLYRSRIQVSTTTEGVTLGEPEFSRPGTVIDDEFFGESTVFFDPVEVRVPVTLPDGVREAELQVRYQGCAKAGLCYPPQTRDVLYYPGGQTSITPPTADTDSATGLAGFLSRQSVLMIAGVFFLLGLGLTFTPCVLPMVPIISSMVSGRNTQSTGHALLLSVSYVLGMAITYAAAGVVTGLLGASFNLQAQLQSPWVLGTFAALFALFALSMFGLFEIQLPRAIREPLNDASQRLTGGRIASIFGIGALSALIVSPCVSAPLAGSLLYISTTQDAVVGGIALLMLGLGMGVPLILVAVGGRKLLPTSGHWMNAVKHFYGVMLLAVAIWLLERLIPAWATLTLWGLLTAVTGVQLGAFDAAKAGWQRTRKGLGLILFAYGLALLAGAMTGAHDPLKPLSSFTSPTVAATGVSGQHDGAVFNTVEDPEQIRQLLARAAEAGRPAMLDFYADWCISCKVMERNVFSTPEVAQALASRTLIQIDMTDNTPAQQALLNELGLFGPPAILFFDSQGREINDGRVLGEMDKDEFLSHLRSLASH